MKKSEFFKISKNVSIESCNHQIPTNEMLNEIEEIALQARESLRKFDESVDFNYIGVMRIDEYFDALGFDRDPEEYEGICFAFSIFICKVLCDKYNGRIIFNDTAGYMDVIINNVLVSPYQQVMVKFYDLDYEIRNDLTFFLENTNILAGLTASKKLVLDYEISRKDDAKRLLLLN